MKIWLIFLIPTIALTIWGWNVIKFLSCDFKSDYKCEIVHGIGVFFPPSSVVTVWFDDDDS